jgi:putative DNA primase/helicase
MNLHIPAVCLSVVGSTQPARITQYVKAAVNGTAGDDGLIQRFNMVVWPDFSSEWHDVDRWPDGESKRKAFQIFERLDNLDPTSIGAEIDTDYNGDPSGTPYLRFHTDALQLFREWRTRLEQTLRSGDLHPAMESHLSKYRKLIPGLALIIHLTGDGKGPVTIDATLRALAWGEYLQTHAERLYASVTTPDVSIARKILSKIRSGKLPEIFKIRDVYRPKWAGLTDIDDIKSGIKILVDHDWLIENNIATGGRPTVEYKLNPKPEVGK